MFCPLHNAKIVGPAPEIPAPKTLFANALLFTASKVGINYLRIGSIIKSYSDRPISS